MKAPPRFLVMGKGKNGGGEEFDYRPKAAKLCREYLAGPWKHVTKDNIVLKRISGGLTNVVLYCSVPQSSLKSRNPGDSASSSVPTEVLLRLYGAIYYREGQLDSLIKDNVVFTILSERRLGPKLYAVFAEGRLEEFVPSRSLAGPGDEVRDPEISAVIARKMARIHRLSVPISKDNVWLADALKNYAREIDEVRTRGEGAAAADSNVPAVAAKLLAFDYEAEIEWMFKFLSRVHSPVVFCHNDVQGGNILLRHEAAASDEVNGSVDQLEDRVIPIDYEYCAYNYRAFDLANHFSEWMYDYSHGDYPFYKRTSRFFPSKERQIEFFHSYLFDFAAATPPTSPPPPPLMPIIANSGGRRGIPSAVSRSRTRSAGSAERREAAAGTPEPAAENGDEEKEPSTQRLNPLFRSRHISLEQQTEILYQEVQVFLLAPALMWCMWAVVRSQDTDLSFGFWEYAAHRMEDYMTQKNLMTRKLQAGANAGNDE